MRVVFLSHYYPPEVGAPQTRISGLARGLAEQGVEITIHTVFPHYPDGGIKGPYRNRLRLVEGDGQVRVVRSAVYPAANRGVVRRLVGHASFAASALATAPATGPADIIVVETPPLFLAGAATAYARRKRAPLVLNVSDLWPDSAVELGALRSPFAIRVAQRLERACYRQAVAIVCPTRGIATRLRRRPEAVGKVSRIAPSVSLEDFVAAAGEHRPGAGAGRPFRVLYAGTVGIAQGVGTLLEAMAALERESGGAPVEAVIAGDGAEAPELRARLATGDPGNVRMLGTVPADRVPELYAQADVAVVLLRDRPILAGALPTKLLEAMAAGRPTVLAARGEAADLVREAEAGVVIAPEDPSALAGAVRELAADPARAARLAAAGRRLVERGYTRERAVSDWHRLLDRCVGDGARAAPGR